MLADLYMSYITHLGIMTVPRKKMMEDKISETERLSMMRCIICFRHLGDRATLNRMQEDPQMERRAVNLGATARAIDFDGEFVMTMIIVF